MSREVWQSPLASRYASAEMVALWNPLQRYRLWRRLWLALAEAQRELGLPIREEQLQEMRAHLDDVDLEAVARYERRLRHDVMAHVHAFGDQCPQARPIIHWGATSCFVTDNADLILLRQALELVRQRLLAALDQLAHVARQYRHTPCLGLTHLQPAQPTTLGKRICLWAYDLVMDLEEINARLQALKFRSTKGTTGTQASFLQLFQGDHQRVVELERRVAAKMGFARTYPVTGQTYPRKVDAQILAALAGIGSSVHKAGSDLRILAARGEVDEPAEEEQVGSSAMAYKRNPMRSERMCSLGRYLMELPGQLWHTAATQWMERTLDDSAIRRIVIPEAFLAADAVLLLMRNIMDGLVVYPKVMQRYLHEQLPFLATENILMEAVRRGGDRQELHERIRQHAWQAVRRMKEEGVPSDMLHRLQNDPAFSAIPWQEVLDPQSLVGRAPQQVEAFLKEVVEPLLERYGTGAADPDAVRY